MINLFFLTKQILQRLTMKKFLCCITSAVRIFSLTTAQVKKIALEEAAGYQISGKNMSKYLSRIVISFCYYNFPCTTNYISDVQ